MITSKLNLAENLLKLRRQKGVTQDDVAAFLNVTKASVSKWETQQSFPDILLLPQLAAYFDISIDDLMGYQPQLSKEQIKKYYLELAKEFSEQPFEIVLEKSRKMVKQYYSCYPFVLHIVILWINHLTLLSDEVDQKAFLEEIIALCDHIRQNSDDVGICSDAVLMRAVANLQLGRVSEVIDALKPLNDPMRIGAETLGYLIKAYQMNGDIRQAEYYGQIAAYTHVLGVLAYSTSLIELHLDDFSYSQKTILRINGLIDLYELEELHPNAVIQFYYISSLFYGTHERFDEALKELRKYTACCLLLVEQGVQLHGDAYFNRLGEWFENNTLGADGVRDSKLILDSMISAFDHPILAPLVDDETILTCKKTLCRKRENLS